VTERTLILVFVVDIAKAIVSRNLRIDFRVPDAIVHAIEHTTVLHVMIAQSGFKAKALVVFGFPGVTGRDRGNEVGIDNPAFHQVHCSSVARVAQSIGWFNRSRFPRPVAVRIWSPVTP